jgi:hypothetical protein
MRASTADPVRRIEWPTIPALCSVSRVRATDSYPWTIRMVTRPVLDVASDHGAGLTGTARAVRIPAVAGRIRYAILRCSACNARPVDHASNSDRGGRQIGKQISSLARSSSASRPPLAGETGNGRTRSSCPARSRSTVRLLTGGTRAEATAAAPPATVPRLPHPRSRPAPAASAGPAGTTAVARQLPAESTTIAAWRPAPPPKEPAPAR